MQKVSQYTADGRYLRTVYQGGEFVERYDRYGRKTQHGL
jgi:hypothetical protein